MSRTLKEVVGILQNVVAIPPKRNIPARMLFDVQKSYAVYGMKLVIQDLLQNFVKFSNVERYEIFTMPQRRHMAEEAFSALAAQRSAPEIRVHDYQDLVSRFHDYAFTQWFDPASNYWAPAYLREMHSRKLYPITVLHHTLSYQSFLSSAVLPILLGRSYGCDSLVCSSKAARATLSKLLQQVQERLAIGRGVKLAYEGRLDIIPLGVDTDLFCCRDKNEVRRQIGLPLESCILLYLGRMSVTDKGDLIPLLRVMRDLVSEIRSPEILLVMAGGQHHGSLNAINKEIAALNLSQHVRVVLAPENRHLFFSAADIFVSPADNIQESFGLTVIEALASGLPQVVAEWNGYRDTVSHGQTGFLVPTYWAKCDQDFCEMSPLFQGDFEFEHGGLAQSVVIDLEQYRRYLFELILNPDLRARMAACSRERALQMFSWQVVVKQYEELWRELACIASRLPFQPERENHFYAQPAYYQAFAHYATHQVSFDTRLRLTRAGVAAMATGTIMPEGHANLEFEWLQEDVLRKMLEVLQGADIPERVLTLEQVIDVVRSNGFIKDWVCRHVLWLMKHGLVQIASES